MTNEIKMAENIRKAISDHVLEEAKIYYVINGSSFIIGDVFELWARGAPQQLATTSMAPRGAILLVRFELITSRSLC
jgi:hypothetical protein